MIAEAGAEYVIIGHSETRGRFGVAEEGFTDEVLKIFGAAFHIYDPHGALVGYCKQKAFKLKEDIRMLGRLLGDTLRDQLAVRAPGFLQGPGALHRTDPDREPGGA